MTDQPLTPPPELVQEWLQQGRNCIDEQTALKDLAIQAARWGADQELEACCVLMDDWGLDAADLTAARRPQPQPSLREQALSRISTILNDPSRVMLDDEHEALELSRRALEQLND